MLGHYIPYETMVAMGCGKANARSGAGWGDGCGNCDGTKREKNYQPDIANPNKQPFTVRR